MAIRIEQGAPFVDPSRETGRAEETRKRADRNGSRRDGRDSVQISREGRMLQAGRDTASTGEAREADGDGRMEQILRRLENGYYDGREASLALADQILEVFGI